MTEFKSLKEILKDEMRAKSMTIAKLAEITGISPVYIQALVESDLDKLPAAPYVRGYLSKIAEILEIDFDTLWKYYAKESDIQRSGEKDELPGNRFAARPVRRMAILWILAGVIALIILVPVITNFFGRPIISLVQPIQDTTIVSSPQDTLEGKVENPNDRVFVNGTEIQVSPDGHFQVQQVLDAGANSFTIAAKRFLGGTSQLTKTIFFNATSSPTTPTQETQGHATSSTHAASPSPAASPESSVSPRPTP